MDAVGYVKLVNGMPAVEKVVRENGIALQVPESSRTYYFHFPSARERDDWAALISANIEILRRAPGVIETMISKVRPRARGADAQVESTVDNGTLPREKFGIIKMALRGRFQPRPNPDDTGAFPTALAAVTLGDVATLRRVLTRDIVAQATATGTTLLIKACAGGSAEMARMLLDVGAAVDQAKVDGDTPLIIAGNSSPGVC
jgi:hypothetical protein